MYNKILLAIELAHLTEGKSIVDHAVRHAESSSAELILLNVVEEIPDWAGFYLPPGTTEKSLASAREELTKIADSFDREMKVDVRVGHAYATILNAAEDYDVDLIILASHRPGKQDFFLGSTAAKVVRHANCSVLVAR